MLVLGRDVGLQVVAAALANPATRALVVACGIPGSARSTGLLEVPANAALALIEGTDPRRRALLAATAHRCGCTATAIHCDAPVELAIARQLARPPSTRQSEHAIRSSARMLDMYPPTLEEGFDVVERVEGWRDAVPHFDARTVETKARRFGQLFYRWRTQDDERVRPEHARRFGRLFAWAYPPAGGHPGEDYGCRCWAEGVDNDDVVETRSGQLRARPLTVPRWAR